MPDRSKVGWDDWLPACDETTNATDAVQWDCLGKKAIQAYLMTSFLEDGILDTLTPTNIAPHRGPYNLPGTLPQVLC